MPRENTSNVEEEVEGEEEVVVVVEEEKQGESLALIPVGVPVPGDG